MQNLKTIRELGEDHRAGFQATVPAASTPLESRVGLETHRTADLEVGAPGRRVAVGARPGFNVAS